MVYARPRHLNAFQEPPARAIVEIQAVVRLGHNNGLGAIDRVIEVVGRSSGQVPDGKRGGRVYLHQRATGHAADVQAGHVPGRGDVVRQNAGAKRADHAIRLGIDHRDGSGALIGHIDPWRQAGYRRVEVTYRGSVDVRRSRRLAGLAGLAKAAVWLDFDNTDRLTVLGVDARWQLRLVIRQSSRRPPQRPERHRRRQRRWWCPMPLRQKSPR